MIITKDEVETTRVIDIDVQLKLLSIEKKHIKQRVTLVAVGILLRQVRKFKSNSTEYSLAKKFHETEFL